MVGIATLACLLGLWATRPQVASARLYREMVRSDSAKMVAASRNAQRTCSIGAVAACSADVATVHDDVVSFQGDLDAHRAPACLEKADADLRRALADDRQSTEALLYGLAHGDATVMQRSVARSASGSEHLAAASVDLENARC